MKTATISHISQYEGKEVTLKGWVFNLRSSGKIAFLQFRDGTGIIQVIADQKTVDATVWNEVEKLTLESSVEVTGTVTKHPKKDEYEIQLKSCITVQRAEEYPIGKKDHGPDFLLDQRHLWLRSKKQWAILRIRSAVYKAMGDWLNENDFVRFDSPIFTPSACEGTTTLFDVDYFDLGKAHLTQSGQLYLEAAIASLGRVYDFGPVFRAEKSKTRRHLTEFWMMDAEAAFVEHEENMKIQEGLISYVVQTILKNHTTELAILERDVKPLEKIKAPFDRITHKDAIKTLQKLGSKIQESDDLGADDEAILTKEFDKPVFVEKYPAEVKAFYMRRDPQDESRVLCADLLAPEGIGEIVGGSEREASYDILLKRIQENHLSIEDFQWYLDIRKYGSVPHSGFGVGLERVVRWIGGIHHIRETIPFPRTLNRIKP